MEILKETRSLCPECLKRIPATVVNDQDEVWITKECPEHGSARGLIERDLAFYRKTMNPERISFPYPLRVMVPITHRCNLDCAFCYVPNRDREDMTVRQVAERTAGLPPFHLCLTGGEPTLHEDLSTMVTTMHQRPNVLSVGLVTNGLKLADPDFIRQLENCGVNWVLFSFNGFDDEVYMLTNKQPLFEIKMKALENLQESNIVTAISPTIVRGLNEHDLEGVLDYILDHEGPLLQMRVRTAAQVGTYRATESLCTSELLDLFARQFGRTKDDFLEQFDSDTCFHSPYQFNMTLQIECEDGKKKIKGWDSGYFSKEPASPNAALLRKDNNRLAVNLFGWPDKYSIDLDDIQAVGVKHMTHDGRILDFLEAIVRYEQI